MVTSLVSLVAHMHVRRDLYCESFPNPSLMYFLLHKFTWLNFLLLVSLLTLPFERNLENSAISGTERKRRHRMLLTMKVASWWKLRPIFILVLLFYGLFFFPTINRMFLCRSPMQCLMEIKLGGFSPN